jgi:hypothetical protein
MTRDALRDITEEDAVRPGLGAITAPAKSTPSLVA